MAVYFNREIVVTEDVRDQYNERTGNATIRISPLESSDQSVRTIRFSIELDEQNPARLSINIVDLRRIMDTIESWA